MIFVSRENVCVEGLSPLIATELSMLILSIKERDEEMLPLALAAVYTDGGKRKLDDALEKFKEDTTVILDKIGKAEKKK